MAAVKNEYQGLTLSIMSNQFENMEKFGKGLAALLAKQDALSNAMRSELSPEPTSDT
jgi:hypothetical protein